MPLPLDQWSDEQLAAEAQGGASACFETLIRRYQVPLVRFLSRSVSQADAEDVMQDAFVQAYVKLHRYNPDRKFKTWLFVIAQRLMIDRLRRKRPTADVDGLQMAGGTDPADHAANRDRQGRLWTIARRHLDDEPYQALWLHYVEDMSAPDIAKVLGRSWVWVKTALHRARKKLQPHLASMANEGISMEATEVCQTV